MKFVLAFLRAFFPFLFKSNLVPFTLGEQLASGGINPFPRGYYRPPFRTNGASRRRKSNRLHLSTKTRNKHR